MSKLDALLNRQKEIRKYIREVDSIGRHPMLTSAGREAVFLDEETRAIIFNVMVERIKQWDAELTAIHKKIEAINELLGE